MFQDYACCASLRNHFTSFLYPFRFKLAAIVSLNQYCHLYFVYPPTSRKKEGGKGNTLIRKQQDVYDDGKGNNFKPSYCTSQNICCGLFLLHRMLYESVRNMYCSTEIFIKKLSVPYVLKIRTQNKVFTIQQTSNTI